MNNHLRKSTTATALALAGLTTLFAQGALACGTLTPRMAPRYTSASPMVRPVDPPDPAPAGPGDSPEPSMAGLWKTVLTADGGVVMVAFDTWHNDGTESSLDGLFPPATGNVCPGVWERVGPMTYATVHPAFEYDDAGVNIVAIFVERMKVTISGDGNSFKGTFTWDNYDFQGTLLSGSVAGAVTGTRVAVASSFPFPFPL